MAKAGFTAATKEKTLNIQIQKMEFKNGKLYVTTKSTQGEQGAYDGTIIFIVNEDLTRKFESGSDRDGYAIGMIDLDPKLAGQKIPVRAQIAGTSVQTKDEQFDVPLEGFSSVEQFAPGKPFRLEVSGMPLIDGWDLNIELEDSRQNPVQGADITIVSEGVKRTVTTNDKGLAELKLLPQKNTNATVRVNAALSIQNIPLAGFEEEAKELSKEHSWWYRHNNKIFTLLLAITSALIMITIVMGMYSIYSWLTTANFILNDNGAITRNPEGYYFSWLLPLLFLGTILFILITIISIPFVFIDEIQAAYEKVAEKVSGTWSGLKHKKEAFVLAAELQLDQTKNKQVVYYVNNKFIGQTASGTPVEVEQESSLGNLFGGNKSVKNMSISNLIQLILKWDFIMEAVQFIGRRIFGR